MAYAVFQNRVPLHTVEQMEPAIADMQRGEADVLWPGRCSLFAATAGTTTGQPRLVPCTEELIAQVQGAGLAALLYYTVRVRHAAVFRGRHLMLGGSTALQAIEGAAPETYAGDLSGIAASPSPPGPTVTFTNPAPVSPKWRRGMRRWMPSPPAPPPSTFPCSPACRVGRCVLPKP